MTQPGPYDDQTDDWAKEEEGLVEQTDIPAPPDFKFELYDSVAKRYMAREAWNLETAVALAYGYNPDEPRPVREASRFIAWRKYVKAVRNRGKLTFPILPADFLDWAQTTSEQKLCSQDAVNQLLRHRPAEFQTRAELIARNDHLEKRCGERAKRADYVENLQGLFFVAATLLANKLGHSNKDNVSSILEAELKMIHRNLDKRTIQSAVKDAEILFDVDMAGEIKKLSERSA